jgi:large subunit ribosomal protein L9
MKVLLKEDVDNLGYAGEVHTVADGFGRNFLLPKGLAVKATPEVMKKAESWRKQADNRRAELRAEHDLLSEKISAVTLTFTSRAGDTGKLYGSITTAHIADRLNEELGTDIDRRKIGNEPLRHLGEHQVVVRLSADHHPSFTVLVVPEGMAAAQTKVQAVESAATELLDSVDTEEEVEEVLEEEAEEVQA